VAERVWAFDEIHSGALPLVLSPELTIRIPTVAGFAAAKLGAWLDRAEWLEVKDAADLALIWLLHLGCIRSGVGPASPRMIGRT
jgi:predicted nucleotidyltransferase